MNILVSLLAGCISFIIFAPIFYWLLDDSDIDDEIDERQKEWDRMMQRRNDVDR